MTRVIDLVGQEFGLLTVVERVENSKTGQARFRCSCTCGGETISYGASLRRGESKSCGCLRLEAISKVNLTHGHNVGRISSKTRNSWRGMKERCDNPKNSHYPMYGGRGISYTPEWKFFQSFLDDMGERPEGMTLERIDVNEGYSKENCKWDSLSNQAFNINIKSNNKSGRSGVWPSRNGLRWLAFIGKLGKSHYLGTFDTFEEACEVREKAELEYYGRIKK